MRIEDYTKEMVDEKSFIDMAYLLLKERNETMNLYDVIDEFKRIGGYEYDEIENRIVQFYTDLNTDGRFLNVGENQWGLRDWYSVDDIEEKIAPTIQKFDILDEEDEEDKTLALLGEDEKEDLDVPVDAENDDELEDPEDEHVEDEIESSDLVVEEDDDDFDDEEDEEDEEEDEF